MSFGTISFVNVSLNFSKNSIALAGISPLPPPPLIGEIIAELFKNPWKENFKKVSISWDIKKFWIGVTDAIGNVEDRDANRINGEGLDDENGVLDDNKAEERGEDPIDEDKGYPDDDVLADDCEKAEEYGEDPIGENGGYPNVDDGEKA